MNVQSMLKISVITLLIPLLSGCYSVLMAAKYVLTGGGVNPCEDYRPMNAYLAGCSNIPNYGVTKDNVNDKDGNGTCFLLKAVVRGDYDMFEALLNSGADIEQCRVQRSDWNGNEYSVDIPQEFWNDWIKGRGCEDTRFPERFIDLGMTPTYMPQELLWHSIRSRCPSGVRWALKLGANPNQPNDQNHLPLSGVGLTDDQLACAEVLIEFGADPYLTLSEEELSPYQYFFNMYDVESEDPNVVRFKGKPINAWERLKFILLRVDKPSEMTFVQ